MDFLLAETINSVLEGQIMAEAAAAAGLPFIVSFVVNSEAKLLDGTPIAEAVRYTDLPGRVGVCLNCRPIGTLDKAFGKLSCAYGGAIGLYPNGIGHAHDDLGWRFEQNQDGIAKFVASALRWRSAGAKIIGGCCGTTPAYIRALHLELQGGARRRPRPVLPQQTSHPAHPQDLA